MFYEGSDAFRDFNHLERYGINPTVTLKPDDFTRVKLSYEYYHDGRTADRGNPSQSLPGGVTRFNPTTPFAPNGNLQTFFGSPSLNTAQATVQTGMNLSPTADLDEAAANLFGYLRSLDAKGPRAIAVMAIPEEGLGEAINDRLRRAAVAR